MNNRVIKFVLTGFALLVAQVPAIALTKEEYRVQANRCHELVVNQHYDRAMNEILSLSHTPYADPRLFIDLADCYRQDWAQHPMQIGPAKDCCYKALSLNPSSGTAYDMLGQIASLQERHEEAVRLLTKALSTSQPDPVASYHRAKAYASLHRYREGLADLDTYEKYLKANGPDDHHSLMADSVIRAQIYQDSGQYDLAVTAYRRSFPRFKTDWAERQILECMIKANHLPEAVAELSSRIKRDSQDAQSYFRRAGLEVRLKKFKEAITDYSSAIEIEPTATYYRERANAHKLAGELDLAQKDIQKASLMDGR